MALFVSESPSRFIKIVHATSIAFKVVSIAQIQSAFALTERMKMIIGMLVWTITVVNGDGALTNAMAIEFVKTIVLFNSKKQRSHAHVK